MVSKYSGRLRAVLPALFLATVSLASSQPDSLLLENLGSNINSEYNDVGPVISPDGATLYFDRTDHPNNVGNDDIWYSTRAADGSWTPAVNMGAPLNTRDHNFVSTVTPDGNTLLLGNVYNANGSMGPGVSIVRRTRNGWGKPQKLNIINYYSRGLSANYYLGNDGKTLLMAIERDDTYGDLDLYVSFLRPNGDWSEPANLGSGINTRGADRTPFLAADGVTLYFASDGRGGFGSSDIWVTRRLDSTWTKWSKPENLGAPINSDAWDGFFTIPASGEFAYLVSGKNSYGAADIFRVKLVEKMRPRPVVLVSGRVFDAKTRKPIAADIRYSAVRSGADSKTDGEARTDPASGSYRATLPAGRKYSFTASAEGYASAQATIDIASVDAYTETTRDFYLKPLARRAPKGFGPILFATGSAELSASARRELDRVVAAMERKPARLLLYGHTDAVGETSANDDLSARRADAVLAYLRERGINAESMTTQGFGENEPVRSNDSESGRRQNRRVEIRVEP